jgi:hypothetical protein
MMKGNWSVASSDHSTNHGYLDDPAARSWTRAQKEEPVEVAAGLAAERAEGGARRVSSRIE